MVRWEAFSIKFRNYLSMLVYTYTFLLNGGLNLSMFLCLFLFSVVGYGDRCCGGVNFRVFE